MLNVVVAFAHSHSWFLTQTSLQSLRNCPPVLSWADVQTVVVDNSWDSSPSIRGVKETALGRNVTVIDNKRSVRSHGGALDLVLEKFAPDYLLTMESDVTVTRPNWLEAFWTMMRPTDFVVGAWHDTEQFVNPSFALYRAEVLRDVVRWSKENTSNVLRWGPNFSNSAPMPADEAKDRTSPFWERRGWPEGTVLQRPPRNQNSGPGWYEPGQLLFHWAINKGLTFSVMPSTTERGGHDGTIPIGTFYGPREAAWGVHWWAGSRGLTTMFVPPGNPDWTDPCITNNREYWLAREAKQWLQSVPKDIQEQTIRLIQEHGWRTGNVPECNLRAIEKAEEIYRKAGIDL